MPSDALSSPQAIENIDTLTSLESLFLGKNKITKLQNLDALSNLRVLSMQVPSSFACPTPTPTPTAGPAWPLARLALLLSCTALSHWGCGQPDSSHGQ